jgi:hypothetical protein
MDLDAIVMNQLLGQRTKVIGILPVNIMVTGNDMHCHTKLYQSINKHLTISAQDFIVHILTMFKIVTQVKNGLDAIFFTVGKEHIGIEPIHVIKEDVTSILYTRVCVIQDCNFVTLHKKYSSSSWKVSVGVECVVSM